MIRLLGLSIKIQWPFGKGSAALNFMAFWITIGIPIRVTRGSLMSSMDPFLHATAPIMAADRASNPDTFQTRSMVRPTGDAIR